MSRCTPPLFRNLKQVWVLSRNRVIYYYYKEEEQNCYCVDLLVKPSISFPTLELKRWSPLSHSFRSFKTKTDSNKQLFSSFIYAAIYLCISRYTCRTFQNTITVSVSEWSCTWLWQLLVSDCLQFLAQDAPLSWYCTLMGYHYVKNFHLLMNLLNMMYFVLSSYACHFFSQPCSPCIASEQLVHTQHIHAFAMKSKLDQHQDKCSESIQ